MRRLSLLLCLALLAGCASPDTEDDLPGATTTGAGLTVTPRSTLSDPFATPTTAAQATPSGPGSTPPPPGPTLKECPTEIPPNGTSGRQIHLYVGSESGRTSCVRVEIDGLVVMARDIESPAAGLPAVPFNFVNTRLDKTEMTVWVEESGGGKAKGETFALPPEVYLTVKVTADDIVLSVSDRAPS